MNTLIICITIITCVYILCYHINKSNKDKLIYDSELNDLYNDMNNIKVTVDKLKSIELYSDAVKYDILSISNIVNSYCDEEGVGE